MSYERILKELKKIRKERKMPLRVLAKELGMGASNMAYIERGEVPMKLVDYIALCKLFEIDPGKLLNGLSGIPSEPSLEQKWKKLSEKEQLFVSEIMDMFLREHPQNDEKA